MTERRAVGPGRVLALAYGFFTLAAGARSAVQLLTQAGRAPLAYGLSAFAAAVYLAGTIAVVRVDAAPDRRRRVVARALCVAELTGVAAVGTLSLLAPQLFPEASVWSGYGSGYGWVPLALPVAGLFWLRSRRG